MKRAVRLTAKAEADVANAYLWCEKEREDLGLEFIRRVDEAIKQIGQHPTLYAPLIGQVRRCILKQFPYALWYRVEEDAIVIACLHHKRSSNVAIRRSIENPEIS